MSQADVTQLLIRLRDGDPSAMEPLLPLVYADLRRAAHAQLRRNRGPVTLNTTALVHEAFLRLVDRTQYQWEDRGHFLAVYSVVMRNLIIDLARAKGAAKRGGDRIRVTWDDNVAGVDEHAAELLAVHDALTRLETVDSRLCRVVECRFFAGLTEVETAEALGVTDRTVRRDWTKARALLRTLLTDS